MQIWYAFLGRVRPRPPLCEYVLAEFDVCIRL